MRTGKVVRLKDTRDGKIYKCVAYRISNKNYCYLFTDEHHRPIAFYQYEIDKGDFELL